MNQNFLPQMPTHREPTSPPKASAHAEPNRPSGRLWAWAAPLLLALGVAACGGSGSEPTAAPAAPEPTPVGMSLEKLGGFTHPGGLGASEFSAFDPITNRLFVINGALGSVDILDLRNPASPSLVGTVTAAAFGPGLGGVNSVAVRNGIVALAIEANPKTNPGVVGFFRAGDFQVLGRAAVGALPDMLTFSPNGRWLLVANEGEPNSYGQPDSVDPEGSVSVIELAGLSPLASSFSFTVTTADFRAFNAQADALRAAGVRLFGPGASVAQDLEPEYITVSEDNSTAWITLQENNAIATLDIASKRITGIKSLGLKDHSLPGNGLDVSDEDGGSNTNSGTPTIKIANYPIKGMYMPDAVASYTVGGRQYLITANEGDAREYTGINSFGREDPRVREYCTQGFDSSVFGAATTTMGFDSNLGRLRMTTFIGNGRTGKNAQGQCNEILAFGGRSISIWSSDVQLLWDSGDQMERFTASLNPTVTFNASNDNGSFDNRSPAKGPEPEGVAVAKFGAKTFAFVGLERVGGVMVYDVTNPNAPSFVTYLNTRTGATGDRGPEGLTVIAAKDSPSTQPLLVVNNETSGTTAVFAIRLRY